MLSKDRSIALVFNGEIYNFKDLSRELAAKGHQFRTHCDTEVIVHAWEEWGEGMDDQFGRSVSSAGDVNGDGMGVLGHHQVGNLSV